MESEYTESNVETLAANQAIGQLAEPTVAISSVTQGVGTGQPSTFQFTVSLTGTPSPTEPVSISYTTVDGSATAANGDYTPVSGTLTWAPGDTSPQTISVPVTDVPPGLDAYFLVELSNPVNTEVQEANGVGEILAYTEYATTTTLSASTLSTPGQANVTLTAVVTNQDGTNSPGVGQVDFYDGSTDLGTVDPRRHGDGHLDHLVHRSGLAHDHRGLRRLPDRRRSLRLEYLGDPDRDGHPGHPDHHVQHGRRPDLRRRSRSPWTPSRRCPCRSASAWSRGRRRSTATC